MKKYIDEIQENARIIDDIADKLLEDHIELMNENKSLRVAIEKKDKEIEALRRELALLEGHGHPGYVIGMHWLASAYHRICAGEPEREVMIDYGYVMERDE